MSFAETLRSIVDGCGGGIAAALMGRDGIPIEQVVASDPAHAALIEDVGVAGVEFGRIVDEVRKASDSLAGGQPRECVFLLQRFTIVVHGVDDDTFVALVQAPDGNLGKARYLIRRQLIAIRAEL
jgi:predicted regulator of Ras-like GTPase activity (Roadblock/LC7/MglB family)